VRFDDNKYGEIGRIIEDCSTMFYAVPFPHGNNIEAKTKIDYYKAIKGYLDGLLKKD
jgi:hypothetical protein